MSSAASPSPDAAEQGSPAGAPLSSPARGLPPSRSTSSRSARAGVAGKIAAFASGVAPVQRTDEVLSDEEQEQTVEELLHRLEAATRGPPASEGCVSLPVKMVLQVVERFGALSQEAARLDKELEKAKDNSSQGLLMPSAWVKREHKYKQDLEMFERKIGWQAERIERLEAELVRQREGDNVRPLEEKINELESRLRATAEEKTQAMSKFHELSIKHRQLIETSPQVSAVWREVVVQQSNGKDAAAVNRLTNFDLRHTNGAPVDYQPAESSSNHSQGPAATVAELTALHGSRSGSASVGWDSQASQLVQLAGQAVTASLHQSRAAAATSSSTAPDTQAVDGSLTAAWATGDAAPASSNSTPASAPAAAGAHTAAASAPSSQQPLSAEAQAQALIASIAAEQASPEAAIEALQQLNYDLTMQLGMYQQMVLRLKDAMEESDLAKAELEASSASLEMQLEQLRAQAQQAGLHMSRAGSMQARTGSTASKAGWGGWWRGRGASNGRVSRESVPAANAMSDDEAESVSSMVRGSLAALSVQSSLDGALFATAALDGDGEVAELSPRAGQADAGAQAGMQSPRAAATAEPGSETPALSASTAVPASTAGAAGAEALPADAAATFAAYAKAQAKLKRAAAAAAKAAEERDQLAKEAKEAWRQVASMGEENRFLVTNLVEIKTELAEAQGTVLQFKRALLRAMDDKVCMETKVAELRNMLNMATATVPSSSMAGSEPSGTPHAGSTSTHDDTLAWVGSKAATADEVRGRVSGGGSSGGGSSSPPGTPPSASGGGAAALPSDAAHAESSLDGHALSDGADAVSDGGDGASSSDGENDEDMQVAQLPAEAQQPTSEVGASDSVAQAEMPASDVGSADTPADQQQQEQPQQQQQEHPAGR